ncbi:hypothetical protein Nmel_018895 [Mimus melanotis]
MDPSMPQDPSPGRVAGAERSWDLRDSRTRRSRQVLGTGQGQLWAPQSFSPFSPQMAALGRYDFDPWGFPNLGIFQVISRIPSKSQICCQALALGQGWHKGQRHFPAFPGVLGASRAPNPSSEGFKGINSRKM